jgi:hypothetical protein
MLVCIYVHIWHPTSLQKNPYCIIMIWKYKREKIHPMSKTSSTTIWLRHIYFFFQIKALPWTSASKWCTQLFFYWNNSPEPYKESKKDQTEVVSLMIDVVTRTSSKKGVTLSGPHARTSPTHIIRITEPAPKHPTASWEQNPIQQNLNAQPCMLEKSPPPSTADPSSVRIKALIFPRPAADVVRACLKPSHYVRHRGSAAPCQWESPSSTW